MFPTFDTSQTISSQPTPVEKFTRFAATDYEEWIWQKCREILEDLEAGGGEQNCLTSVLDFGFPCLFQITMCLNL
jgi:hypothetical protein